MVRVWYGTVRKYMGAHFPFGCVFQVMSMCQQNVEKKQNLGTLIADDNVAVEINL